MHADFANWYQPVTFGHENRVFELRWAGIEAVVGKFETSKYFDLIKLIFGFPSNESTIVEFKEAFKVADATFMTAGNDNEVKVLAGAVLAYVCSDPIDSTNKVALALLATSFNGRRKLDCAIDLIGLAKHATEVVALSERERPDLSEMKKNVNKKRHDEAINSIDGTNETLLAALKKITTNIESLSESIQESFMERMSLFEKYISIQDEEIDILWWLIGGWSDYWSVRFDDINQKAKPLLLSHEAFYITSLWTLPPSIESIFIKVGITDSDAMVVVDTINALTDDYLVKLIATKNEPCPILHPIHYALVTKKELNEVWSGVWSKKTSLPVEAEANATDIAIQYYSEKIIL